MSIPENKPRKGRPSQRPRPSNPTHLDREYILDVYCGGVLVFRHRNELPLDGTLPVYSVNTRREAEMLQVRTCVLSRTNNHEYRLNPSYRGNRDLMELSDLHALTSTLARIHAEQQASQTSEAQS